MAYSAVHNRVNKSVHMADIADADPELAALWLFVIPASAPWGRLPAHVKLFKAAVCPLVDRWTGDRLYELICRLVEEKLLTAYTCPWTGEEAYALTTYHVYNQSGRQYHRMLKPEFGPPPGWVPPRDLIAYMRKVADGGFKQKTLAEEAEKFGFDCSKFLPEPSELPKDASQGTFPKETSQGNLPGNVPIGHFPTALTGTETETETETEERRTSPTTRERAHDPRRAASGDARRGKATPATPRARDAPFVALNGPQPKDATKSALWSVARKRWRDGQGTPGEEFMGYIIPQEAYDGPGQAAAAGSGG